MDLTRRTFMKTAAAGAAATSAMGTASGSTTSQTYSGVVSTREHFDISWWGNVYRTDGNDRTDYETVGTIPGMTNDDDPEDLIIFIHGWKHTPVDAREKFRKANRALRNADVTAPMVGYSWDSNGSDLEWWDQVEIADLNADKLGTFIREYKADNPDTNVRVIAHSLGAVTAVECLEFFMDRGYDTTIQSVDLLGAAVDDQEVAMDGEYGQAIADHCESFRNYYKSDDETLGGAYEYTMWDGAVGKYGIQGEAPPNYEDHDVTYVEAHDDHPKPEKGCMPEVVENWE